MVERFIKTLLSMLGTVTDRQKLNWKEHVSTMTQAYNAILHENTGYSRGSTLCSVDILVQLTGYRQETEEPPELCRTIERKMGMASDTKSRKMDCQKVRNTKSTMMKKYAMLFWCKGIGSW